MFRIHFKVERDDSNILSEFINTLDAGNRLETFFYRENDIEQEETIIETSVFANLDQLRNKLANTREKSHCYDRIRITKLLEEPNFINTKVKIIAKRVKEECPTKLDFVRLIRDIHNKGLKEAKDYYDAYISEDENSTSITIYKEYPTDNMKAIVNKTKEIAKNFTENQGIIEIHKVGEALKETIPIIESHIKGLAKELGFIVLSEKDCKNLLEIEKACNNMIEIINKVLSK